MSKDDNLNMLTNLMYEHYIKPYTKSKTLRKMQAAIHHEMTCTDPSHTHGIIKVSWSAQPHPPKQGNK